MIRYAQSYIFQVFLNTIPLRWTGRARRKQSSFRDPNGDCEADLTVSAAVCFAGPKTPWPSVLA